MAEITINLNDEQVTVPSWAKEETQLEIKQLLSGKGPGKSLGKDLDKAGKAVGGFDKSLKSAIPGPTKLAAGALNAAESLLNFGTTIVKTALTTKGSLTDLNAVLDASVDLVEATFGQIPVVGGIITFFAQKTADAQKMVNAAFEELAVNFEQASQSGASFGGNLTEFSTRALDANIRLDTFNSIIANNNETFARLGGTVSDGARRFMELNKMVTETADGTAKNFRGLGLSLQDVAELNADILEINSRNFNFQRLNAPQQAQILESTIARFATLGRLTGKRADQIAEEIKQTTRRGDVAAALATMDDQQRKSFEDLSVVLNQFGPNFAEAGNQILAIGTATGDAAKVFATTGSDLGELQDVINLINSGASPEEVRSRIAQLEGNLRETVGSETSLSVARLASVSDTAGTAATAFESAANLIASTADSTDRFKTALDETRDALALDDGLTNAILQQKAELENLGLTVNEKFVKLLTDEDGLKDVILKVQEVQLQFVNMMNDFFKPFFEASEAKAKAAIEAEKKENIAAGFAMIEQEDKGFLGNILTPMIEKKLDVTDFMTEEAMATGGPRGRERTANINMVKNLIAEELGKADVDKSGTLSEAESTALIDSLNKMIEQNDELARIMNKVDKDLINGIDVRM